jgi:predicted glycoside hydrolase/deacetylase ChbG (UPF0249 family)
VKCLIVNADDCNLTEGVTSSILDCHDRGIVTSTTFLVNLPVNLQTVRRLKARRGLGVGLHLNVTLGEPVSRKARVSSLIDGEGGFARPRRMKAARVNPRELYGEYRAQVELFRKVFGRLPTHLDTHHQLHDFPLFYKVLAEIAQRYRLPVRRSRLTEGRKPVKSRGIRTPDRLLGSLDPECCWTRELLASTLRCLPDGVSEIMCHPGRNDAALRAVSSLNKGRNQEARIFSADRWRQTIDKLGIILTHYGVWYNQNL